MFIYCWKLYSTPAGRQSGSLLQRNIYSRAPLTFPFSLLSLSLFAFRYSACADATLKFAIRIIRRFIFFSFHFDTHTHTDWTGRAARNFEKGKKNKFYDSRALAAPRVLFASRAVANEKRDIESKISVRYHKTIFCLYLRYVYTHISVKRTTTLA